METSHVNNAQQAISYAAEPPEQQLPPWRKWTGLIVMSLALAIIVIDTSLLNVSLKTIINDLNTDIESMQWVITAYTLILSAFTITGGRLGDLFGRKRMFIVGAVIFALGSFIASISKNVGTMIAGEAIIEGIGAALMLPATASLLISTFKGKERSIAFGIWGGIAAASSAIGPILGGWLTTNYSWRWGFRINIFVAAALLIGSLIIRETKDKEEKSSLDIRGVVLSGLGMLSIVFGFIKATSYGWLNAKEKLVLFGNTIDLGNLSPVPLFIGLGLIILVLFVLWERAVEKRGKTPLVSLELLKNRQFVVGTLTTTVISLGMAGLVFSIPVFLQAVRNLDALHTGLTMLPLSLSLLVAAPVAGFLGHKFEPKHIIQFGLLLNTAAYFVLRYTLNVDSGAQELMPGFILFGVGMGLTMSQISNISLSAVSVQQAGEASGVNNTMRQVGMTLGSAVLGAILLSVLATNLGTGVRNSEVIPPALREVIAEQVQQRASAIEFGGAGALQSDLPPQITEEISTIAKQATTDANKTTLFYGAMFSLLGFIVASFLKVREKAEVAVSAAPSKDPSQLPLKHAIAAGSFAVLVIAALTGILGYYIGLDKNTTQNATLPTPTAIPTVVVTPTAETTPTVTPSSTPAPSTTPTPTTSPSGVPITYTDSSLAFSATLPSSWTFDVNKPNPNTTVFYNTISGISYGQVDRYEITAGTTLEAIAQQLKSSPDVDKVTITTLGGGQALQFTSTKNTSVTVAAIKGNYLYYLSGQLTSSEILQTWKFN